MDVTSIDISAIIVSNPRVKCKNEISLFFQVRKVLVFPKFPLFLAETMI